MDKLISIIIPAFNEAGINETISGIRKQSFENYEIIVVDGKENGSTINIINDPKTLKIISERGRARQMNAGAKAASGDILIFLHSDTYLPDNALVLIHKTILSGFKAGAFDLKIQTSKIILKIISKTISLRARIMRIPYGDQALFFKKDFFDQLGGYKEIPLMEDIEIMQRLKKRNEKIFIIPKTVSTSDRRWLNEGLFYVIIRNPILSSLYYLGVPAEKLAKFYK